MAPDPARTASLGCCNDAGRRVLGWSRAPPPAAGEGFSESRSDRL